MNGGSLYVPLIHMQLRGRGNAHDVCRSPNSQRMTDIQRDTLTPHHGKLLVDFILDSPLRYTFGFLQNKNNNRILPANLGVVDAKLLITKI